MSNNCAHDGAINYNLAYTSKIDTVKKKEKNIVRLKKSNWIYDIINKFIKFLLMTVYYQMKVIYST